VLSIITLYHNQLAIVSQSGDGQFDNGKAGVE
jgi:hypothetical protein